MEEQPVTVADRITELAAGSGREVDTDDTWVSVHDPAAGIPPQGWKLHVSARPGTLASTLDRVLPVLFAQPCDFKVARSTSVLRDLNSGDLGPSVGKAITVYPRPDDVVALGRRLAEVLTGLRGPRVMSDRRVRPDAPVYYRYGPFAPQFRVDANGEFELVVIGPAGEALPGEAGPEYTCPPWATDPFGPDGAVPTATAQAAAPGPATEPAVAPGQAKMLGGRYRVTSGVMRGPRARVYGAEAPDGRRVVVKEARAYVGESPDGLDVRAYLRNERRILESLAGVAGVPEFIDHFRHDQDEYLVTSEAGVRNLNRAVGEFGVFADGVPGSDRDLGRLAGQLVGILDAIHARGVVVRDLSPKNVVLDETGRCTVVDFGNSGYAGFQLPGWTPGYSLPGQQDNRPGEPADDYYALGATLYFAATGMNPVIMDADPARNLDRTLLCLDYTYPDADTGIHALLPALLSHYPGERTGAVARIRAAGTGPGTGPAQARPGRAAPSRPRLTPGLLADVVAFAAGECARFAEEMMDERPGAHRSGPPITNVYSGSAGLGMELLHYPEAAPVAAELARWTARTVPAAHLPPSLLFGRTGITVYLTAAKTLLAGDLADPEPVRLAASGTGDYAHGVAGVGAGHLCLAAMEPRPQHLAIAAECARRLLAGEVAQTKDAMPPGQPGTGVALESAFAHGAAGIAYFLLRYAQASGDQAADEAARKRFELLAADVPGMTAVLAGPGAQPMGASWCQGMSGVATALLHAGQAYGEPGYLALARDCARACLAIAPRAWVVSQCCGLAGIGDTLIDIAIGTGDGEFWQGADRIAELILIRSGGEFGRPVFPGNGLDSANGTWGTGSAGVLAFLRRLQARGGPRSWTADWRLPRLPSRGD